MSTLNTIEHSTFTTKSASPLPVARLHCQQPAHFAMDPMQARKLELCRQISALEDEGFCFPGSSGIFGCSVEDMEYRLWTVQREKRKWEEEQKQNERLLHEQDEKTRQTAERVFEATLDAVRALEQFASTSTTEDASRFSLSGSESPKPSSE